MVKNIKEHLGTIITVTGLAAIMMGIVFFAPTEAGAANSSSGERYDNPTEITIDPYEESKKFAEEQQQEIREEGAKVENQTVAGEKTSTSGLYLANKVKGVAVKPDTSNEGAGALYVETLDTDTKKSSAAMASIEAAAKASGAFLDGEPIGSDIGPVVDVYFKKTDSGKMVDGTAKDVDFIKIGVPDSFKEPGYYYGYVIVFPGGKTVCRYGWGPDGRGTDYVEVDMVHETYNDPVDYSQATIALIRSKDLSYNADDNNG